MPDVIETTVYRLDELSEAAKDNARAWYREGGFDYQGRRYSSLTEIARGITGTHWSGPRFFGLQRAVRRSVGRGTVDSMDSSGTADAAAP